MGSTYIPHTTLTTMQGRLTTSQPGVAETAPACIPTPAFPTLQELTQVALSIPNLFHLPVEILYFIFRKLDTYSALDFLSASRATRNISNEKEREWLRFEKKCLLLFNLPSDQILTKLKKLKQCYQTILADHLLQTDISDDHCAQAAKLANKFFKYFPSREFKQCLNAVLSQKPAATDWEIIFKRLARIDLQLCTTLITFSIPGFNINKVDRLYLFQSGRIIYPFTEYYPLLSNELLFDLTRPSKRLRTAPFSLDNIELANVRAEQFFRQIRIIEHGCSTALHFAVAYGYMDVVPALSKTPYGIDLRDATGRTPLLFLCQHWAIQNRGRRLLEPDDAKAIHTLLTLGANPNAQDHQRGTALMCMSQQNNIAVVELLLQYGAHINQQDISGLTALMLACQRGNTRMVSVLLQYHADIARQDTQGFTALMHTCHKGHPEVVRLLLAHESARLYDAAQLQACINIVQTVLDQDSHTYVTQHYQDIQLQLQRFSLSPALPELVDDTQYSVIGS